MELYEKPFNFNFIESLYIKYKTSNAVYNNTVYRIIYII